MRDVEEKAVINSKRKGGIHGRIDVSFNDLGRAVLVIASDELGEASLGPGYERAILVREDHRLIRAIKIV